MSSTQRFAAVVDGDNLTRGAQLDLGSVTRVLGWLSRFADEWPVTFAIQGCQVPKYLPAFAGCHWAVRFVPKTPDAADRLLIEAAAHARDHGVTDLVVASGDHAFAELAGEVRLHVFCYRSSLSRQLELAATTVTYLDELVAAA